METELPTEKPELRSAAG